MNSNHYLTCLWPGLPEVWWRGQLASLPLAIGFGALLNLFLVLGWLYPDWIPSGLFWMGTLIGVVTWGYFVLRNLRGLAELIHPRVISKAPDRFPEAHVAYLKGNWELAEELLTGVLAIEPRDPPALLMLCAVYRQLSQVDHAAVLLSEVSRLEVSDAWWVEIEAERKRIRRALAQEESSGEENSSSAADMTGPQAAAA